MARRELILHVGLPKTGSSALQSNLYENRDILASQGCEYGPIDTGTAMPKHQYIVRELKRGPLTQTRQAFADIQHSRALFSSEGLSNHLYDFKPKALREFCNLLEDVDLTAFIVLRDPKSWVRSYYKQAVINPYVAQVGFYATALKLSDFSKIPRIQALSDHKTLSADIASAFSTSRVVTAAYEKDWFAALCNCVQIDASAFTTLPQVNESPPEFVIEILRQLNAFKPPEPERAKWKVALHLFSQSNHTLLRKAATHQSKEAFDLDQHILDSLTPTESGAFPLPSDVLTRFLSFLEEQKEISPP